MSLKSRLNLERRINKMYVYSGKCFYILIFYFWICLFVHLFVFKTGSLYVALASLKLTIIPALGRQKKADF